MFKTPLLAAASALQLLMQCGGGGGTATTDQQLNTQTYLDEALDAKNLFHWTPRMEGEPVELHVIIHNGPGQLPSGFDAYMVGPEEVETFVREAATTWAEASTVPFDLRFHAAGGEPLPTTELCPIEVSFVKSEDDMLAGFAWLETRFLDPRTVESVQVQLKVPAQPANPNLNTVRALLLHEFGHALGIVAPQPHTGHSSSEYDVMHPEVRWTRLSESDKTAISKLYAMEANILRGDRVTNGPTGPNNPAAPEDPTGSAPGPLRPWFEWTRARLDGLHAEATSGGVVMEASPCQSCR